MRSERSDQNLSDLESFEVKSFKLFVFDCVFGALLRIACFTFEAASGTSFQKAKLTKPRYFVRIVRSVMDRKAKARRSTTVRQIPNLREGEFKYKTDGEIYRHISEGGNGMTPFRGQLTDREIDLMVRFVQDQLRAAE